MHDKVETGLDPRLGTLSHQTILEVLHKIVLSVII